MANFKYDLGSRLTDQITGFTGVSVGRAQYLTGCNQYCLQPKVSKDGNFKEYHWFDENRLLLQGKPIIELAPSEEKGCDITPPKV